MKNQTKVKRITITRITIPHGNAKKASRPIFHYHKMTFHGTAYHEKLVGYFAIW